MMSRNDSWHRQISTGRHFQNGRHKTAQIQHCPISTPFDMWVDNDVPNWFPTLNNFYWSPFSKWQPQYRTNWTLSDFNTISFVGRLWYPELIPHIEKFLPVAIFKMATTISHKFNIVWFQRPELIPNIEKILPVYIFKMTTTIPQKFNIVRFQRLSFWFIFLNLLSVASLGDYNRQIIIISCFPCFSNSCAI